MTSENGWHSLRFNMGTEKGLILAGVYMMDAYERREVYKPAKPLGVVNDDPLSFGRGTFNHRGLGVQVHYVGATLHKFPYRDAARARLLRFLELQERHGHCCLTALDEPQKSPETNSPSHGQLNEAWAGLCLWAALKSRAEADELVVRHLLRWWWAEIRLCQLTELPGARDRNLKEVDYHPTFWGPGWRGKSKKGEVIASNPCRDLCGRLALGYPVPPKDRSLWRDKYNVAARALASLKPEQREALKPPASFEPTLPYAFHRYEYEHTKDDFVTLFDGPEGKPGELTVAAGMAGGEWFAIDRRDKLAEHIGEMVPTSEMTIEGVNPWP